ncbi:MAG: ATP-binding protein [Thermoanaerobaculaceae bacterium]|jgi:signal transduction histidine kinase/signal recognition particle receptor subunit beta|nr:ATP-binding protein [Thermoanaerobaculaceae bacterium]
MVQFDNQYRQVKLKVVYYGPGLCGKTTCLQYIHRVTDPQRRTKLYALNTASDRTLFFDLLSLDLGRVRGYRVTLQLYTVPGQVQYNATRRAVLAGADGVVFVVDSQRSKARENQDSLANLAENLRANGLDPDTIPIVLHYNKRDLPEVLSRPELDQLVNRQGLRVFETVATQGTGVVEGFAAITESTVLSVADRLGLSGQQETLQRLVGNVRTALQPLLPRATQPVVEGPVVIRPPGQADALTPDELVADAVRANVAMGELSTRLDSLSTELARRVSNLHSINEFGHLMSLAREPEDVTGSFFERFLRELRVSCGTLMVVRDGGELYEVMRKGLASDPMGETDSHGEVPARTVITSRQPFLAQLEELEPAQVLASPWLDELRGLGFISALAVPLIAQDRPVGLVTAYADTTRGPFEDEELELATVMSSTAAVALANARAWRSIEQINRNLEGAVAERTRDLQEALGRVQALATQVEDRNLELEAANRQLRDLERLKGDLLSRVAHELNTPVTAIQTSARILGRYGEVPPDKAAKFVEIITQEAGRLADLIASALQAAVLGFPEGRPQGQTLPLADLLKRALAPLRTELSERKLTLQVKIAAGLEKLWGDGEQLEAAVRAIVRNAVEFNREGGSVTIIARPARRGGVALVELRIEDTGPGIPADDLPHVTEVFWQGGNVLTSKPRGLGLGLAVARRVAENHRGALDISSEVGKGTVVSLFLPAQEG